MLVKNFTFFDLFKTIGVEDVWISRYKPKLIFIIHQGDIINTITGNYKLYEKYSGVKFFIKKYWFQSKNLCSLF